MIFPLDNRHFITELKDKRGIRSGNKRMGKTLQL